VIVGVGVGALGALAGAAILVYLVNQRSSPRSIRVAILGMPQVGKTTLITACFEEIFSRRVNIRAVMSGSRTFEQLNSNISLLSSGFSLKPTRDQDVSAYRFEITPSGLLVPRYRVEFGDFPGEDTERYVQEYGPWLHGTPFFEWALTCDSFAFCVDSGPLAQSYRRSYSPEGENSAYVGEASGIVRAAWQNIVASFDSRRIRYLRKSPVLLVFTKVDLLLAAPNRTPEGRIPNMSTPTASEVDSVQSWLKDQFADLINYLQGETTRFSVVATSAFTLSADGRQGISEFLHGLLPPQAFYHPSRAR
jgi:hypothetical protein